MNNKIGVVYTCITGDYDDLKNHFFIDSKWDYICFTDNKNILNDKDSVWKIKPLEFNRLDNTRNQRWHKLHPHILFPQYQRSIWIDASIDIINEEIFNEIDTIIDEKEKMSIAKHPERDCIYDEALVCINFGKDNKDIINNQINELKNRKFPSKQGLFETNIIYREHNDNNIIKIMEDWWWWIENYSRRDQLSLNYVLWKNSFNIRPLNRQGIEFIYNDKHITKEELLVQRKTLRQIIEQKDQIINLRIQTIRENERIIQQKDQEINALMNSTSWKITKPIRFIKDKTIFILKLFKKVIFIIKNEGVIVFLRKLKLFLFKNNFNFIYNIYYKLYIKIKFKKREKGLISVITPIYNRTWELRESIESILNQTYKNFELILVTDGSPKETMSIVEEYRNNPKIRIFHFYNNTGNAVRGRNKAIKEARGEFIAFQDSDDIAEVDRLEKSIQFIEMYKADVVYGGWRAILDGTRQDTGLFNNQEVKILPDYDFEMLKTTSISPNSVMVRKSAIINVGGLKPIMQYREDHELWLRLAYFGYKFKAIPFILTTLRFHKGNNELVFKKDDKHWLDLMYKEYKKKGNISPKIMYIIPGNGISGGVSVILYHLNGLLKRGYDVSVITVDNKNSIDWFPNQKVPVIPLGDLYNKTKNYIFENIDILVATHWSTFEKVLKLKSKRKFYFIQSDERNFERGDDYRKKVQTTYEYNGNQNIEFFTMAKWIQRWLKDEFNNDSHYVPNGLDCNIFHPVTPLSPKGKKIRVLLEGPINIPFKGMADAFEIVKDLDCEIWAVSSYGKPELNWRCDRFFEGVNLFDMPAIYSSCDILLKMSKVESFAYPPLEMMACGGVPVILKVPGIEEYAKNNDNCIIVKNNNEAKKAILKLISDRHFYDKLKKSGLETAKNFNWDKSIDILDDIINNKK